MKQFRLYIAERFLYWALDIMPDSTEKMLLARFLKTYGELIIESKGELL